MATVVLERWLENSYHPFFEYLLLWQSFLNQTQYYGNIQSYFIKLWKLSKNQYSVWKEGVILIQSNSWTIWESSICPFLCLFHAFRLEDATSFRRNSAVAWRKVLLPFGPISCPSKWSVKSEGIGSLSAGETGYSCSSSLSPSERNASYCPISFPKKASTFCHVSIYFLIRRRKGRTPVIMTLTLPLAK